MARKKQPKKPMQPADLALVLANHATQAYLAADELHVLANPVEPFPLITDGQAALAASSYHYYQAQEEAEEGRQQLHNRGDHQHDDGHLVIARQS